MKRVDGRIKLDALKNSARLESDTTNATHQGSVVCRLLVFPEVRDYSSTTRDRGGVGRVIVLQRNGDGLLLLVTDNDDPTVSDVEEIQLLDNVGRSEERRGGEECSRVG